MFEHQIWQRVWWVKGKELELLICGRLSEARCQSRSFFLVRNVYFHLWSKLKVWNLSKPPPWIRVESDLFTWMKEGSTLQPSTPWLGTCRGQNSFYLVLSCSVLKPTLVDGKKALPQARQQWRVRYWEFATWQHLAFMHAIKDLDSWIYSWMGMPIHRRLGIQWLLFELSKFGTEVVWSYFEP